MSRFLEIGSGERWLQTVYCWRLSYQMGLDLGREQQELLHCYSPPDGAVKPEYRHKTECRVCKECGPECEGGYNAAHWSLFFILHEHLKPGAGGLIPWKSLWEWKKTHIIEEASDEEDA